MSIEERGDTQYETDPYLMTVLSKKFEMVTRSITQSLLKSARSGVINTARDFSSAVTLYNGRQFMYDEGLPAHAANIHLIPEYTLEKFDDIKPGDCFLTNTGYAGNSHHADYTLHAPVFYDGEPLFWSINKAHQADVGAPEPNAYLMEAATVYEEGPHFPSLRVQEEYEDKEDIIRMLQTNIRLGEQQWYGDYRAQVAAVRTGEKELENLCDEYGVETVTQFASDWIAYGKQMMESAISKLPAKEIEYTAHHDPVLHNDAAPDGIPVNVKLSIEPEEGQIHVDLTDNMDNIPAGVNLTEATTMAGVYGGIFYNLDTDIPHNHGSASCVKIDMDVGKIVGIPEYPVGTSVATTNVCDVLFNAVQAAFGDLDEPYGIAEGTSGNPPHYAVVSGEDHRSDDEPYINQIVLTGFGGPGVYGHDGWITYGLSDTGGVLRRDSVELDEQKFPILIEENELIPDTEGAGEWRGAPAASIRFRSRGNPITFAYNGNGGEFPPQGILGGEAGASMKVYKITEDGDRTELPVSGYETIERGEHLYSRSSGGGGYRNPIDRNPARVKADVKEGFITIERARDKYGVVLRKTDEGLELNENKTEQLRNDRQTENT